MLGKRVPLKIHCDNKRIILKWDFNSALLNMESCLKHSYRNTFVGFGLHNIVYR